MYTLHLVSHTHWDREWHLTFQQFRLKLVRLIDDLLDLLDRDPNYSHFMLDGQTIILEDYLTIRPEREPDLRRHIQSGRISIGPWYILPDEFLVSPEATIRNLLEGVRTTRIFGPRMMIGYIPDSFGHIGQMPQILRGFGIEDASVMRGLGEQPCEFWWESPDGSRVLMAYLRESYSNAANFLNGMRDLLPREANRLRDALAPHSATHHLLLMFGTDHMPTQPASSTAVAYLNGRLGSDRLVHSTLSNYLCAVRTEIREAGAEDHLPVVIGELRESSRQPLLPGVLSTRMWIKQRNAACENLLEAWAEPFSVWAAASGGERLLGSPSAALHYAWRLLMQCHPHDSICGCSLDQVHDEMRSRFDQVQQIGDEITNQSLETLAERISTRPAQVADAVAAVVVFNPSGGMRTDLVRATLETLPEQGRFELVDEMGQVVPYQVDGQGSSELINLTMDRKAFIEGFGMVSNGVLMNWKIQTIHIRREGHEVWLRVIVTENGSPNLPAWEQGRAEVSALIDDPTVETYHALATSAEAARVLFAAANVPAHGYRTVWVRPKAEENQPVVTISPLARALMPLAARVAGNTSAQQLLSRVVPDPSRKPPYKIENEYFQVEATADGTLSVLDRRSAVLYSGVNRFAACGDRGDTYNFAAVPGEKDSTARLVGARVERGPVCQVLILELALETPAGLAVDRKSRVGRVKNTITSRVILAHGVPRVDFETTIDNRAADQRLRVHFPAPFMLPLQPVAEHDGHFEVVRRAAGPRTGSVGWVEQPYAQVPQRAFTAIAGEQAGLLVAVRGLPEVEVITRPDSRGEIALTLLRSVGWMSREDFHERRGHAGPFIATPAAQMPGRWTFEYALVPFQTTDYQAAQALGRAYQVTLRAVGGSLHTGEWPSSGSFIKTEPAEFVISAIKQCEDGQGWLVRGYNISDRTLRVRLQPLLPYQTAKRCNLAEEPLEGLISGTDGSVAMSVKGHEIATIRFR